MRGILIGFCLLIVPVVVVAQEEVQIQATVDKSRPIYVGEGFLYKIVIDGDNQPGQPDLSPLAQFQPRTAGNKDVSQTVTTIIGNRQETKTTKRLEMNYILTASNAGTFTLPSLSITHKGKTYQTNPISITVIQPEATKQMDIEIEVSTVNCYVGEPVEVIVHWYLWASIVQGQLLHDFGFNMPVLNNHAFLVEDLSLSGSGNRTVNVNGQAVPYAAEQVEHNGVASVKVSFAKLLIPQRSGPAEIDPVTISADIAVERVQSRDRFGFPDPFGARYRYQRFAASTNPVQLDVKSLPAQGKPADFYGLVGRYAISATAQPTTVNVGDPITITILIGGNYLRPVQWPDLESVPHMADWFKIPTDQAGPEIQDGRKVFTQTLRAISDNVTEIPGIPLTYFDTDQEQYITIHSEPIPLDVAATKIVTTADVEGRSMISVSRQVEAAKKGLSANIEDAHVLKNQQFVPTLALIQPIYTAIWGLPLVTLLGSIMAKFLSRQSPQKKAARRRKTACSRAIARISKTGSLLGDEKRAALAAAMKQYIADHFDRTAVSLTSLDCEQLILIRCNDASVALEFRRWLEALQASVYAGGQLSDFKENSEEIMTLIRAIEKKFK